MEVCLLLMFINLVSAGLLSGSLRSEYLNELSCPQDPVPIYTGKINYAWLLLPSTWYIPMGSERAYRLSAEILLGRPARNSAELDLIELKVSSFIGTFKISGFGNKSFQKLCVPISRPINTFPRNLLENTCFSLWGTRGSDVSPAARAVDSIIWTDNENAALITPCNQLTMTYDWFVLTKRATLSDEAKEHILNAVAKLGFNPKNAVTYDYENKKFFRSSALQIESKATTLPIVQFQQQAQSHYTTFPATQSLVYFPSPTFSHLAHSLAPLQNPFSQYILNK